MASSSQTAVTPDGIRDGDPAALAALVERRANAVLAYCEAVLSPSDSERAAAEAFARFRAAVATASAPRALDPEALLLGATRHAAAALTPPSAPEPVTGGLLRRRLGGGGAKAADVCALVPDLLAARAEGVLSEADAERLARHLERHAPCRERAAAATRAEAAYATPPDRTVPIGALTEIMLALAAAAPITAAPGAELEYTEVLEPEVPEPRHEPVEAELIAPAPHVEPEPEAGPPVAPESEPPVEPAREPERAEPPVEPAPAPERAEPRLEPEQLGDARTAVIPIVAPPASPSDPNARAEPSPATGDTALQVAVAPGGVAHPRPPRRTLGLPGSSGDHGLLYRYVLPGTLVALALLAAMVFAGVFSDDPPPPLPRSSTLSAPASDAPPVVSGAVARMRDARAQERRERAIAAARRAARERTTTSSPPPAASGTVPEAAPDAATPEPTTPAPATPSRSTPRRTTPAPASAGTVEREPPAESSSSLPGTESAPEAPADPGVFEGTPAPATP